MLRRALAIRFFLLKPRHFLLLGELNPAPFSSPPCDRLFTRPRLLYTTYPGFCAIMTQHIACEPRRRAFSAYEN